MLNMQVLNKSRKCPREGDVFAYHMPDGLYHFGRVIRTACLIANWPNVLLAYFYNAHSESKCNIPILRKESLLIPPTGIGTAGWRKGYFETVEYRSLDPEEVLAVHCFEESWCSPTRYWTEFGERLPRVSSPVKCGACSIQPAWILC